MGKILTISVAAYNVENYLEQLINSIVACSQSELIEILIVNDGSKDGTLKLSKDFERKYPDIIRVLDKENGGHGSTINQGILNASGKYFRAFDGDDWVDTKGLDLVVKNLASSEADLIICDYLECYESGKAIKKEYSRLKPLKEYTSNDLLPKMEWLPYHAVIYRTEILQNAKITLDEKCFYVDAEYMAFPMPYISTIIYYNIPVYCYRLGEMGQSVSAVSRMKHVNDSRRVAYKMMEFLSKQKDKDQNALYTYLLQGVTRSCLWHFNTLLLFSPKSSYRAELIRYDADIKKECLEVYLRLESNPKVHLVRKTHYYAYYSESITNLMRSFKNHIKSLR